MTNCEGVIETLHNEKQAFVCSAINWNSRTEDDYKEKREDVVCPPEIFATCKARLKFIDSRGDSNKTITHLSTINTRREDKVQLPKDLGR